MHKQTTASEESTGPRPHPRNPALAPKGTEDASKVALDPSELVQSRYQKRAVTQARVRKLAETIRQTGRLLNPVSVRTADDRWELIAGHCRVEAFKFLRSEATTDEERTKWARIPAIVHVGLTEVQVAAMAAVENMGRDDGDPVEQGLSLLEVKKAGAFQNNNEVAEVTGLSKDVVQRLIQLAESPEPLRRAVSPGVWLEVTTPDGLQRHEHRCLEPSVVLAANPYYRHVATQKDEGTALLKTEALLARAARGEWTRKRLRDEVRRLTGGHAQAESESDDSSAAPLAGDPDSSTPAMTPRRLLHRDRGDHWVLYHRNIDRASAEELAQLRTKLAAWIDQVDQALRGHSKPPGPAQRTGASSNE